MTLQTTYIICKLLSNVVLIQRCIPLSVIPFIERKDVKSKHYAYQWDGGGAFILGDRQDIPVKVGGIDIIMVPFTCSTHFVVL
jgi:hypothetical protein